ncbi:MAG: hypothetical protein WCC00_10860, partial [Candidatus Aminicenantales bacterium]
ESADLEKVRSLLRKARDYCDRLSRASLDFVCVEDITEKSESRWPRIRLSNALPWNRAEEHRYLYDYQFISKNGQRTEKRRLLEYDGVKEGSELTNLITRSFDYRNVLFGAVDLLAESFQNLYRYRLKGRELLDGEDVCVIDAIPVSGVPEDINQGRIWIRENDASVLKVLWNVQWMERLPDIQEAAKRYKGQPEITAITEFKFEKNGVRFPSRFLIEEAYITNKGKKLIGSIISVVYRDYRFFTVEVERPVIK